MNSNDKKSKTVSKGSFKLSKPQKHDVNLRKNSTMYFQIGLILSLLGTYFFMDMQFLSHDLNVQNPNQDADMAETFTLDEYQIYKAPVKKEKTEPQVLQKKKVLITKVVKPIDNNYQMQEPTELLTELQTTISKPVSKIQPSGKREVAVDFVDQVPVFPGCEGLSTNAERKQCLNDKIARLVKRRFDTSIGYDLGLAGQQRFFVQFKIDENGNVAGVKTSAQYNELDREAKRVIAKIPKMQPGKQQNKRVAVIYNLPINFQMVN